MELELVCPSPQNKSSNILSCKLFVIAPLSLSIEFSVDVFRFTFGGKFTSDRFYRNGFFLFSWISIFGSFLFFVVLQSAHLAPPSMQGRGQLKQDQPKRLTEPNKTPNNRSNKQ